MRIINRASGFFFDREGVAKIDEICRDRSRPIGGKDEIRARKKK